MRTWVSKQTVNTGYGRTPFEVHDRKIEATVLEFKDDKVTYSYKTDKDDWLGDNICTIPVDRFVKAYEPFQESVNFVCYRNGRDWCKDHKEPSEEEKLSILKSITKAGVIG